MWTKKVQQYSPNYQPQILSHLFLGTTYYNKRNRNVNENGFTWIKDYAFPHNIISVWYSKLAVKDCGRLQIKVSNHLGRNNIVYPRSRATHFNSYTFQGAGPRSKTWNLANKIVHSRYNARLFFLILKHSLKQACHLKSIELNVTHLSTWVYTFQIGEQIQFLLRITIKSTFHSNGKYTFTIHLCVTTRSRVTRMLIKR